MAGYLDILYDWENNIINKYLYENINIFFPEYGFVRVCRGAENDHWASPLKLNLSVPKHPNKDKTVVYPTELCFREQGEWNNKVRVIDKIVSDNNLSSIYEGYKFVADKLGIAMPSTENSIPDTRKKDERLLSVLEDYFIWNLWNNKGRRCARALAYLRNERSYSVAEIKAMKLGFVPAWSSVEKYITSDRLNFSIEDLDRVCGVKNEEGWTNVGDEYVISIPYRSGDRMKGFIFRSDNSLTIPKYRATKGLDRKSSFFNIENSREIESIIVVEGELDALSGSAAGIRGMVSIGGSDISGERNKMIFDAFNRNVKKIVLCLDLDSNSEGEPNYQKRFEKNRKSILEILNIRPDFRELYIAELPYCTDPDKFIREHGAGEYNKLISEAKPWWRYLSDYMDNTSI